MNSISDIGDGAPVGATVSESNDSYDGGSAAAAGPAVTSSQGTIQVDRDIYASICAQNLKMRDKLLEVAKQCVRCGGTGCVTRFFSDSSRVIPCGDCEDIRDALR